MGHTLYMAGEITPVKQRTNKLGFINIILIEYLSELGMEGFIALKNQKKSSRIFLRQTSKVNFSFWIQSLEFHHLFAPENIEGRLFLLRLVRILHRFGSSLRGNIGVIA